MSIALKTNLDNYKRNIKTHLFYTFLHLGSKVWKCTWDSIGYEAQVVKPTMP